jgi:hypothetical protein
MNSDLNAAQCAAADAGKYLAMAWMAELKGLDLEVSPGQPIWPLKLAMDCLTEAANALGFDLVEREDAEDHKFDLEKAIARAEYEEDR